MSPADKHFNAAIAIISPGGGGARHPGNIAFYRALLVDFAILQAR